MKRIWALLFAGGFLLPCASRAIDFKQAKFTQVVNNVEVISASQVSRPAAVNDIFKIPDMLRTGPASRAELLANDNTLTRVGANTIFSFDPANRTLDLQQGSVLFHSPHGKGGGTIHTGSATASVLGTTIIVTTTPNGGFKVLVLEGQAGIRFLDGMHAKLTPGQMTFVLPGGGISPIVVFRLDQETAGSLLVNGFKDPLPSWPKIETQITRQLLLLLNNRLQDVDLLVGDNATPNTVQVRMNILDNEQPPSSGQPSPFNSDAAIIGPDHTPSQPLPVNYDPPAVPLDSGHLENGPFAYPGLPSFTDGLLFLGIINPAAGFAGNNIDIDTANIDLSAHAAAPDFNIMAAGDLRLWQSVNFTPAPPANNDSVGKLIVTPLTPGPAQPDAITLFAGGQMLVASESTLEADTGLFGLVADSFGVLNTADGTVEVPNTLQNVSLYNMVGDVDLLSLSDLTIQGKNSDKTIYAGGDVNLQSEGNLTLGAAVTPGVVRPAIVGHNVEIYGAGSVSLNAQKDLGLHNAAVESGADDVALNSITGNINADNSAIYAAGNATFNAGGHVDVENSDINQGGSVYANAGDYVNLRNVYNGSYDANGSDVYLTDWNLIAGSYVNIGADAGVQIYNGSILATGGDVDITANDGDLSVEAVESENGVTIAAGGAVYLVASANISILGAKITAADGGVSIRSSGIAEVPALQTGKSVSGAASSSVIVSISGSSITANHGDVDIQNGTTTTPPPLLPSLANNLNITGGSVITANNGNVNFSTDEGVNLAGSTVHASGSGGTTGNVTVNAGAGITVNGATVTGDAADGTITLNSVSRATTIANGATVRSFYLDVNSPDGILIDGRTGGGVHLTGNTMNLKGSLTDGTKGINVKNADLTAYATVNMSAHTVSLTSVAFGSGSYNNFQTFYGALAANPNTGAAAQSGYLNFINGVTYAGTLVTSGNQSTFVNPASGPGIYVSPLH
jgi:hypothetical protein